MPVLKIISWNVNGVRAAQRHGLLDWLAQEKPDILCLQETKAEPGQLEKELLSPPGYQTLWVSAQKKGYSGLAAFVRKAPRATSILGVEEFDAEGRVQILEYSSFTLVNTYFPNSQEGGKRLDYKLRFCEALLKACEKRRRRGETIVLCGDYNIAHTEIDLKNARANEDSPGYLPEERAWMTRFLAAGYADVFRRMHPGEAGHYTWWSYRFQARQKDIGWRIDYLCVNEEAVPRVREAAILNQVLGSDHCPVVLRLETPA